MNNLVWVLYGSSCFELALNREDSRQSHVLHQCIQGKGRAKLSIDHETAANIVQGLRPLADARMIAISRWTGHHLVHPKAGWPRDREHEAGRIVFGTGPICPTWPGCRRFAGKPSQTNRISGLISPADSGPFNFSHLPR